MIAKLLLMQVRFEAQKLQDLFFDIMKIAFPDADFSEANNAVIFSSPGFAPLSPRLASTTETKRQTPTSKSESASAFGKAFPTGSTPLHDERRTRSNSSKSLKESRPTGGGTRQPVPDCSQLLTHPGDLVICKKRRNDRDKSSSKQLNTPNSPSNQGWLPSSMANNQGLLVHASSMARNTKAQAQSDTQPAQKAISPLSRAHHERKQTDGGNGSSPGVAVVQWANPVRRMRTDTGKRRPSHM